MSVCRGGRQLAALSNTLAESQLGMGEGDASKPHMTKQEWLARWQAKRLYLSADGVLCIRSAMEPSWFIPRSAGAR